MSKTTLSTFLLCAVGLGAFLPLDVQAAPTTQDVTLRNIMEELVPTRLLGGDREFDGHGPDIKTTVNVNIVEDGRKLEARVYFRAKETQADWSETKGEWARIVYEAPAGRKIKQIVGAVEDGQVISSPTCKGSTAGRCVASSASFRSDPAGFQFIAPTEDWTAFIDALVDLVEKVIQAEQQMNDRDQPTPEERQALEIMGWVKQGKAYIPTAQNKVYLKSPDDGGPVRVFAIVGDTGGPDISTDSNGRDDTRVNSVMFKKLRIVLE